MKERALVRESVSPLKSENPTVVESVALTHNGGAVALARVPVLEPEAFNLACVRRCASGSRLSALLAIDDAGAPQRLAALADDARGEIALLRSPIVDGAFPALTPTLTQAQAFERELLEQRGWNPVGHPWAKALRRHESLEPAGSGAGAHPFLRMDGAGVHEVAVGPVHAGVIEPGHFRFQCQGEIVHHLEIQLGYQSRGVEPLLLSAAAPRQLAVAETIAGDTSIGHGLAFCGTLEALAGGELPLRAQALRAIALELERLANHAGDLGALCGDVGYLPGASFYGRLRGEFLNLSLELCGNRFGRGLLALGGVRFDLPNEKRPALVERLERARIDLEGTAEMVFDTPAVLARFEGTGALSLETARELGLVGPAARACGCDRDVRGDHPAGLFRFAHIPAAHGETGDVLARALVRRLEIERSITFVREQLNELASGPVRAAPGTPASDSVAISLVEGWRGEIAHVAVTGAAGALKAYKVVDPSFHNWFGLAQALRGNQISDFPLCNKSFNLSYCGHDL